VGADYGPVIFAVSGGTPPFVWSLPKGSNPPVGLIFDSVKGSLRGTPSLASTSEFSVRVTDAEGNMSEKTFSLTVQAQDVNPQPAVADLAPASVDQGSEAFTLVVTGEHFVSGCQVTFGSTVLATTFVNATTVRAAVPANLLPQPGTFFVYVSNPAPGGGQSSTLAFSVNEVVQNPRPVLAGVSPSSLAMGAQDTQITLRGSSFIEGARAVLGGEGGQELVTTYVSETELWATVPAANLASAGTLLIRVFTPAPGGGFSADALELAVGELHPAPTLLSMSPNVAEVHGADLTLSLSGTSFVSGAVVYFGSTALSTVYDSATSISASLPSALLASEGPVKVTVVNPTPGGGTSNALAFTVKPPKAKLITSLSRTEALVNSDALTIRIQGGPFDPMSRVSIDGGASFLDVVMRYSNLIDFVLPKSALSRVGDLSIAVEQDGELSAPATFSVVNSGANFVPSLGSFSPSTVARAPSTSVSFSFSGSNFVVGKSQLWLNDTNVTSYATFSSATAGALNLSQTNAVAVFPLAGSFEFRVVNPAPGGGSSAPVAFTVTGTNPDAVIASLSPASVGVGSPELTFELAYDVGTYYGTTLLVEKGALRKEFCDAYTTKGGKNVCLVKLPAKFFAAPGDMTFTFRNPGQVGAPATATVSVVAGNPSPGAVTSSVYQIPAGSDITSVNLTGGPFVEGTTVMDANTNTNFFTTFVDANNLTVLIPPQVLANAGTLKVRVTNPGPGGGAAPDFFISVVAGPHLNTLSTSPTALTANTSFDLTLMGSSLDLGEFREVQIRSEAGEWMSLSCSGDAPEAISTMWFLYGCKIGSAGTYDLRAFIEGLAESNELRIAVQ